MSLSIFCPGAEEFTWWHAKPEVDSGALKYWKDWVSNDLTLAFVLNARAPETAVKGAAGRLAKKLKQDDSDIHWESHWASEYLEHLATTYTPGELHVWAVPTTRECIDLEEVCELVRPLFHEVWRSDPAARAVCCEWDAEGHRGLEFWVDADSVFPRSNHRDDAVVDGHRIVCEDQTFPPDYPYEGATVAKKAITQRGVLLGPFWNAEARQALAAAFSTKRSKDTAASDLNSRLGTALSEPEHAFEDMFAWSFDLAEPADVLPFMRSLRATLKAEASTAAEGTQIWFEDSETRLCRSLTLMENDEGGLTTRHHPLGFAWSWTPTRLVR